MPGLWEYLARGSKERGAEYRSAVPTRWLIAGVALLVVFSLALMVFWVAHPRNLVVISGDYEGVVFHTANASRVLGVTLLSDPQEGSYWMPDREIIRRLEEELRRYVRENLPSLAPRLHEYRRQYFGFTRAGNQQIFVVGFCGLTEIDWLKELVPMPSEAGCYFEGQFDVAGAHFLYLWELGGGA